MKKLFGRMVASIGARLWQNGGWTGDESYEDLTVTGKLGYRMFCTGLSFMGLSFEDVDRIANQQT